MKFNLQNTSCTSIFALLILLGTIFSCTQPPQPPEEILPTPCPEETIFFPTPYEENTLNKYIIVLIDKSVSYRRYDNKHDYAAESLILINDVLSKTIKHGDRVLIDWIANDRDNDQNKVIFEDQLEDITYQPPNFYPTPSDPELLPTLPVEGGDIQKDKIKQQNLEIERQNEYRLREYGCNIYAWNNDAENLAKASYEQWLKKYELSINNFLTPMNNAINNALTEKHAQYTHLYEGLSIATKKFHDPLIQKRYNKYILVVFSDMIDSNKGKDYYKEFDIELSNVDVIVANYLCLQGYTKCLDLATSIESHFLDVYGARSAIVRTPIQTDHEILINFIEKGK